MFSQHILFYVISTILCYQTYSTEVTTNLRYFRLWSPVPCSYPIASERFCLLLCRAKGSGSSRRYRIYATMARVMFVSHPSMHVFVCFGGLS